LINNANEAGKDTLIFDDGYFKDAVAYPLE
jgi:hypothetical protein